MEDKHIKLNEAMMVLNEHKWGGALSNDAHDAWHQYNDAIQILNYRRKMCAAGHTNFCDLTDAKERVKKTREYWQKEHGGEDGGGFGNTPHSPVNPSDNPIWDVTPLGNQQSSSGPSSFAKGIHASYEPSDTEKFKSLVESIRNMYEGDDGSST